MKKALAWIAGVFVGGVLLLWLLDDGLYIGSETYREPGVLRGEQVNVEMLRCRYLTFGGVKTRLPGMVPGSDPETLLEWGQRPHVASDGCPISYPWHVFSNWLPGASAAPMYTGGFVEQELAKIAIPELAPTIFTAAAVDMYMVLRPETAACVRPWYEGSGVGQMGRAFIQNPNRLAVETMKELIEQACPG